MKEMYPYPILLGTSRKGMIWKPLNIKPKDSVNGTLATTAIGIIKGANIIRVHDVKANKECGTIAHCIRASKETILERIVLKNLKFYGYHGAFEFEQTHGQRFLVDVEIFGDLQEARDSNNLASTVNYVEVYDLIKEIMEGKPYNLLETLVNYIGQSIIETQPLIQKAVVEVKKPEIPILAVCDYFSVTVTTKREVRAYIALGSNKGDKKGYLEFSRKATAISSTN